MSSNFGAPYIIVGLVVTSTSYTLWQYHAIIKLVDKITKSVDCGDIVINIFVDLKKAFDTVSSDILLKKLGAYGIRGNLLKLCESYLNDRY